MLLVYSYHISWDTISVGTLYAQSGVVVHRTIYRPILIGKWCLWVVLPYAENREWREIQRITLKLTGIVSCTED